MWNSDLWDLDYEFGALFGFNPAIEALVVGFLSHSRLLYIACMGD
jgi:hypothetical protein